VEAIDDRTAGLTIGGRAIPDLPDLARMRERFERLQHQLEAQGVDGLVMLGSSSVAYATGAPRPPRMVTARRCFARWRLW
jgi:Xaa-Pro aminopeptidase